MRRVVPLLLLASCLLLAGCGGGGDEAGEETTTASTEVSECADVEAPDPRAPEGDAMLEADLDPAKTYALVFDTSCGSFTVTLDQELVPKTSASLVALAKDGYFDDTIFHRVVPGFVIQGGDPTQSGSGGPGYSTVDAPPADAKYTKGTVAMAKTQVEAAGTSGSQFFVVTDDAGGAGLTPDYAIVGEVTDGMDTVERIDALGVGDGRPSKPVVVTSVTVTES